MEDISQSSSPQSDPHDTSAVQGDDATALKNEIERLKKESEDNLNGWKRAKADYINYKNEQEKHSKELAQVANMGAVTQIIPIAEHLRKAFLYLPEDLKSSPWVAGIDQITKQLKEALKSLGVDEYSGQVGQQFNPEIHQAVGQEYVDGKDEDSITQEVNAGYKFHGRVLLPARVIVNKKPQTN